MSEGRNRCSLGDLFEIENGFAFKSADFEAAGIPVIKIKNIKANHFAEGEHSFVSSRFTKERPNKVARRGDLLISMSGNRHDGSPETWVGKVAPFNHVGTFLINQRVGALRPKPHTALSTRYFGYLLSSWPFQEHFIAVATSSGGQANLSPSQILAVPVEYPPLPEQRAIAATLGALDDKIELNRKMNATLEAMARALFRDWFIDFGPTRAKMEARVPYLSPDIWALFPDRLDDEGKPEGWEVSPLGELAKVEWGNTSLTKSIYVEEGYPAFSAAGQDGFVTTPERKGLGVVISAIGTVGKIYLASGSWTAIKNTLTVQGEADAVSAFVYYLLQETALPTRGSTQQFISLGDAKAVKVISPNHQFILAFFDHVEPLIRKAISNANESRTLAQTRDLLVPRLMSGELRVADLDGQKAEHA